MPAFWSIALRSKSLENPICNAVRKLVNSGVVVVAAAGNNGKDDQGRNVYGAIHCPGNEPSAITVGASNSFGSDARDEDAVTSYSSRGPTRSFSIDSYGQVRYDNIIKPDLVAREQDHRRASGRQCSDQEIPRTRNQQILNH